MSAYDEGELIPEYDSVFEDLVNLEVSGRSDALLEDSFSSVPGVATLQEPLSASTPSSSSRRKRSSSAGYINRLPCSQCSNTYANQRTLNVHMRMHVMKSVSSRLSRKEELTEIAKNLSNEVLTQLINETVQTDDSQELLYICEVLMSQSNSVTYCRAIEVLCDEFCLVVKSQNVLLPSGIGSAVFIQTNKLFATEEFSRSLKEMFMAVSDDIKM